MVPHRHHKQNRPQVLLKRFCFDYRKQEVVYMRDLQFHKADLARVSGLQFKKNTIPKNLGSTDNIK